jgi:hypothetical protein
MGEAVVEAGEGEVEGIRTCKRSGWASTMDYALSEVEVLISAYSTGESNDQQCVQFSDGRSDSRCLCIGYWRGYWRTVLLITQ